MLAGLGILTNKRQHPAISMETYSPWKLILGRSWSLRIRKDSATIAFRAFVEFWSRKRFTVHDFGCDVLVAESRPTWSRIVLVRSPLW